MQPSPRQKTAIIYIEDYFQAKLKAFGLNCYIVVLECFPFHYVMVCTTIVAALDNQLFVGAISVVLLNGSMIHLQSIY